LGKSKIPPREDHHEFSATIRALPSAQLLDVDAIRPDIYPDNGSAADFALAVATRRLVAVPQRNLNSHPAVNL